uniref:Glycosyltransferase family 92 protein n=1 Tax=Panagrolaimus sp. JU765 TaxID=591449 RepID=A0AC34R3Z7_9BILA
MHLCFSSNSLFYKYGKKEGEVCLACQLPQCPDPYYYLCDVNGYIGFIKNLTKNDNDEYLTLTSSTKKSIKIAITDVRKKRSMKQHKLGACLQPIHLMTNYALFIQYFEYWLNEGVTKFYIYWESYTPEVKRILDIYNKTSGVEFEFVEWSRLPTLPNVTTATNPNSYWFQLEVFLAIFDCMHRARHQVKFIPQTDLDEMMYVRNGPLIDFLEKVDTKNPNMAAMLVLSRKVQLTKYNDYKLSSPREYSFDVYQKLKVDSEPSSIYRKLIYRPERVS